jgi:hypothetical protein
MSVRPNLSSSIEDDKFKPKGMKAEISDENWTYYDNNEIVMPIDEKKIFKLDRISLSNGNPSDRHYKLLCIYLHEHLSFDFHVTTVLYAIK